MDCDYNANLVDRRKRKSRRERRAEGKNAEIHIVSCRGWAALHSLGEQLHVSDRRRPKRKEST